MNATIDTEFPLSTWRVIHSAPARGAFNMALDEAILESIGKETSPPTLRFYSWDPACLSLGYAQPFQDVDGQALQNHGWEVVRRPTGGRAILHTDELTYSVTGPLDEPRLAGGVLESYRRLSKGLLQGLSLLGLPVQADKTYTLPDGADPKGPVCFEVPSSYEITMGGKKLIGSAQARRKDGVLQHGSLPLYGDLTRITQALSFATPGERLTAGLRLLERATTIEAVTGRRIPWQAAVECLQTGFQQVLNLQFELSEPTPAELSRAQELVEQKYNHPTWTQKI